VLLPILDVTPPRTKKTSRNNGRSFRTRAIHHPA
jgi:hypothetical protein